VVHAPSYDARARTYYNAGLFFIHVKARPIHPITIAVSSRLARLDQVLSERAIEQGEELGFSQGEPS